MEVWRGGQCHIVHAVLFLRWDGIVELEVLEVREESDKVQDLSARTPGLSEGKKSKRRGEVAKVMSRGWYKLECLEVVYSKPLEVRERREVTRSLPVQLVKAKFTTLCADLEPLDKWEQTKVVCQ